MQELGITMVILYHLPRLQCTETELEEMISSPDIQETGSKETEWMLWLLVNGRLGAASFQVPLMLETPACTLFLSRVHLHKPIHSSLGFCQPDFSPFTPSALFSPTAAGRCRLDHTLMA